MPQYLKVSKTLKIADMPSGLREARRAIEGFKYKYETASILPPLHNTDEIIKIENLGCKYEDNLVIKDLNISIRQGEFISILGANGAGKSTFLKSLMGLVSYSGSIKVLKNSFAHAG